MTRNLKGDRETTRNVLSLKEQMLLLDEIKLNYTVSGLDNSDYAEKLNNTLPIREKLRGPVTVSHIRTLLEALDIPSNFRKGMNKVDSVGDCLALTARVQALEEQLGKLTAYVRGLPTK
jgi:hypothetical protein